MTARSQPSCLWSLLWALPLSAGCAMTVFAAMLGLDLLGGGSCHQAPIHSAAVMVRDARSSLESFVAAEGRCPTSERELVELRYMKKTRRDPWRQALFYRCYMGSDGTAEVSVRSAGPDRVFWSFDDMVSSSGD